MSHKHSSRLLHNGFTLVELIIVIALLGIALAIAAPSFGNYLERHNLRAAARAISSDIFLTRARAVSENKQYRMTFDQADNSYCVLKRNEDDTAWDPAGPKRSLYAFSSGLYFNFEDKININFQTRGTVTARTISIRNKDRQADIVINFTGRNYVAFTPK